MKKLLITVLCVCALMAALVPPVSADGPTTVSGSFVNSGWIDPPQPTPSGNTCVLTGSGWHQWDGSFRGKEVFDVRIVVYGPCEEEEPNKFREELIGKSLKHRTNPIETIAVQKGTLEGIRVQVLFESICQVGQPRYSMVVTDGLSSRLPDMLLWVQVRGSDRIQDDL
jgi:hypothetical protein